MKSHTDFEKAAIKTITDGYTEFDYDGDTWVHIDTLSLNEYNTTEKDKYYRYVKTYNHRQGHIVYIFGCRLYEYEYEVEYV